ncbi:uncharacterized protein LOC121849595 [Callorhinchus milii]|uniref:uncharacterized protein LOC121849595 n=1 Tax=Callorhinchus milii TaxID=7868 RepID=UPI001C3FDC4B|nr:uncharacterized protein LOC121849595 [Callorhinchus milii]
MGCDELQKNLEKGLAAGDEGLLVQVTTTEQVTEEKESLALATQSGNSTKPTITDSEPATAGKTASKQRDSESQETLKNTTSSSLNEDDEEGYFESKLTTPEIPLEPTDSVFEDKGLFLNHYFQSSATLGVEEMSSESERTTPKFTLSRRVTRSFTPVKSGETSEVTSSRVSPNLFRSENKSFGLSIPIEEQEEIPMAPPPSPLGSVLAKNLRLTTTPISFIPSSPPETLPE